MDIDHVIVFESFQEVRDDTNAFSYLLMSPDQLFDREEVKKLNLSAPSRPRLDF